MTRFFLILALLMLFAIFACEESDDDLDKDFILAYAELRIAEQEYGETEDGKAVRFEILQRYGMDADIFEEKIKRIKNRPEKWLEFQNIFMTILDSVEKNTETKGET